MSKVGADRQAKACVKLMHDNRKVLQRSLKREPQEGEIYLAHFLGVGIAMKVGKADGILCPRQVCKGKSCKMIKGLVSAKACKANGILRRSKTAKNLRKWAQATMKYGMRRVKHFCSNVAGWSAAKSDSLFFMDDTGDFELWINRVKYEKSN